MKKVKKKLFTIFLTVTSLILIFSSCICYASSKKSLDTKDFEDGLCIVRTVGIGTGFYRSENQKILMEGTFDLTGTGFFLNEYVVTAAHVVEPSKVFLRIGKYLSLQTYLFQIKHRLVSVGNTADEFFYAEIVYINVLSDLALLKVPSNNIFKPFKARYTNELKAGDKIFLVHYKQENGEYLEEIEIIWGKVVSVFSIYGTKVPFFSPSDVATDIKAIYGDSGSPIFILRDGEPYVIGVMNKKLMFQGKEISYFSRIDYVLIFIE